MCPFYQRQNKNFTCRQIKQKIIWNGKNTIPMCVPIVLYTEVNSREGPASYRWSQKHHRVIDTRRCAAGAITKPGTQQNKHKNPTTNITTHTHTRWVFGLPHTHTKKKHQTISTQGRVCVSCEEEPHNASRPKRNTERRNGRYNSLSLTLLLVLELSVPAAP